MQTFTSPHGLTSALQDSCQVAARLLAIVKKISWSLSGFFSVLAQKPCVFPPLHSPFHPSSLIPRPERYMFRVAKDRLLGCKTRSFGGRKLIFRNLKHICFRNEQRRVENDKRLNELIINVLTKVAYFRVILR